MIVDSILDFAIEPVYVRVPLFANRSVELLLKLEGFNPGGSIKLKPAQGLVKDLRRQGLIRSNSILIDTSSGNMGIALSIIAKAMSLRFVCVSDEKITDHNRLLLAAYGAELVILPNSTLDDRYEYIRGRLARDPRYLWTRQFENEVNPRVHELTTARELLDYFPRIDHLFVGVGTGGTLAGCASVFERESPGTCIVAVDAEGSRHFREDRAPVPRRIPGIGATRRSPFLNGIKLHKVVIVPEKEALRCCRLLLEQGGWLVGGSSGSVLSAILACAEDFNAGETVVGICADFGERYLTSVYGTDVTIEVEETRHERAANR